jgi:tryptophan 2,3-dioxygenase
LGAKGAMSAGKSILGTVGRGSLTGAGAGAVSGAGTAKELEDVPSNMLSSGILGGAVGGAAPTAINLTGKLVRNVVDGLGYSNATKVASRKLADILDKENLTPDDAQAILDEYRRLGLPSPVLADLGENLRNLGFAAYAVPNKGKTATGKFLDERQTQLAERLVKGLEQKSGVNSQGKFGFDYISDLGKSQEKAAKTAYPKAYSIDIPALPFRKYVDRDVFKDAYENALKLNRLETGNVGHVPLPELNQIRNAQFINTELLHQMKIGLDSVIEKETDNLTGKMTKYGGAVTQVKKEFNNLIKYYNKDYAAANAQFAESAGLQSSYKKGLDYMKIDVKELESKLKKMNPAEKEAFRVGMLSQIKDKLSTFKGTDFTNSVFKSQRQQEALRFAFDSPAKYKEFANQVKAQAELMKTYNRVRGGSKTTETSIAVQDAGMTSDVLPMVQNAATGNMLGLAANVARSGLARAGGLSPESAVRVQNALFNPNPRSQNALFDLMNRNAAAQANPNLLKETLQQPNTYSFGLGNLSGLLGQ